MTFSRTSLQGPRSRLGGPSVSSTDLQGLLWPEARGTRSRRFVPAGPKPRSAMARSWCRSPGRQVARQRSSKRSRALAPWHGLEWGGPGRVWMAPGQRCLENNSLGGGGFWVRSGSVWGKPSCLNAKKAVGRGQRPSVLWCLWHSPQHRGSLHPSPESQVTGPPLVARAPCSLGLG